MKKIKFVLSLFIGLCILVSSCTSTLLPPAEQARKDAELINKTIQKAIQKQDKEAIADAFNEAEELTQQHAAHYFGEDEKTYLDVLGQEINWSEY